MGVILPPSGGRLNTTIFSDFGTPEFSCASTLKTERRRYANSQTSRATSRLTAKKKLAKDSGVTHGRFLAVDPVEGSASGFEGGFPRRQNRASGERSPGITAGGPIPVGKNKTTPLIGLFCGKVRISSKSKLPAFEQIVTDPDLCEFSGLRRGRISPHHNRVVMEDDTRQHKDLEWFAYYPTEAEALQAKDQLNPACVKHGLSAKANTSGVGDGTWLLFVTRPGITDAGLFGQITEEIKAQLGDAYDGWCSKIIDSHPDPDNENE
jgi:hypothetical protein